MARPPNNAHLDEKDEKRPAVEAGGVAGGVDVDPDFDRRRLAVDLDEIEIPEVRERLIFRNAAVFGVRVAARRRFAALLLKLNPSVSAIVSMMSSRSSAPGMP